MSYQNCNEQQAPLTQKILEGVAILNRKLEEKNITVKFDYEDSLYYRDDSTVTYTYFSHQKIKHYGTARTQTATEYEEKGFKYYEMSNKKKFFTLQFLLDVIEKISIVQMKIAEGKKSKVEVEVDQYSYPVLLTYKDLSCEIKNQMQLNNFMNPRLGDYSTDPLHAESIKLIKIKSIIL
jgi:hypothetical protein